jgi:hypothetical protein
LVHHLMDSPREARENLSDINRFHRIRQDDLPKAGPPSGA